MGRSVLLGVSLSHDRRIYGLAKELTLELIIYGVLIMAIGIALAAWGGQINERAAAPVRNPVHRSYPLAIFLAVLCGLMAPMINYSFAFGQDIAKVAVAFGNQPVRAAYAVWPVGLAGGLVPNLFYSAWLLVKNHTWSLFRSNPPDFFRPSLMGVLSLLPAWKQIFIPKEIACTREVRPQAADARLLNVVLQHGMRRRNRV